MNSKPQRLRVSAYALIHDAGRILLCRLSQELPRWQGFWTLPGGGLDFGEHPEAAVIREVEEETGFIVEVKSIVTADSIYDTSGPDDFQGIRLIYHVKIVGGQVRHEGSGTTDLCEWHPLHPTPDIQLGDLAHLGIRIAQQAWPPPGSNAG